MIELIKELLEFLSQNKKLWLAPIIILFIIIAVIIVLVEGTVLAPLIYTLF